VADRDGKNAHVAVEGVVDGWTWSSDGRWIIAAPAAHDDSRLVIAPAIGGEPEWFPGSPVGSLTFDWTPTAVFDR
jgi:hypothetical protein